MTSRFRWRVLAWSLLLFGFLALVAHKGEFERMDAWAWLSLPTLAAAPLVGFRRRPALKWLLASVPFWIYGNANEPILWMAVGLTIWAMVVGVLLPTLPNRRVRSTDPPLPHLASGPLVPVTPMQYFGGQRSRPLTYLSRGFVGIAVALFVAAAAGFDADVAAALSLAALILSATFAFANWFADRVRLRVDGVGVHGRTMFREQTARWNEITGLRLRYLFMPGYGVRLVYYVVESTRTQVSFPSSMVGARELQAAVEAATGVQWPEPEITANM